MQGECVYLEEQPAITVDAHGVKITYSSGNVQYVRRASMSYMERHARTILHVIGQWKAEQARTKVVVPIREAAR